MQTYRHVIGYDPILGHSSSVHCVVRILRILTRVGKHSPCGLAFPSVKDWVEMSVPVKAEDRAIQARNLTVPRYMLGSFGASLQIGITRINKQV